MSKNCLFPEHTVINLKTLGEMLLQTKYAFTIFLRIKQKEAPIIVPGKKSNGNI